MCRLFGFRSVLDSQVHRSLMSADNALAIQSNKHPDGWGVAYYVSDAPHVIRSAGTAVTDQLFRRVSGIVTSQTVLAHIRKATQGGVTPLNCHPFQYGRWVMAHNGDVPEFGQVRDELMEMVSPRFRRFLLGDTDSEVLFHLFLSQLTQRIDPARPGTPAEVIAEALRDTIARVRAVANGRPDLAPALLTIMITDGRTMVAHQGGKELYWSTHKHRCSERDGCPFFAPECEAPTATGYVNHLLVSSEPLQGENEWNEMAPGEIIAVDHFMRLHRWPAA